MHTVHVGQPQMTVVGGTQTKDSPIMTLKPSVSPAVVTTHNVFEGSPEQLKLLNSSGLAAEVPVSTCQHGMYVSLVIDRLSFYLFLSYMSLLGANRLYILLQREFLYRIHL